MARIDKYDPISGGFRAKLNADWAAADGTPIAVGLNTSGLIVVGAGNTGLVGIVLANKTNKNAGDQQDVMTHGEMVETGLAAGTVITANTTTGALSTAAVSATQVRVGHTVEAGRLVVRMRDVDTTA